MAEQTDVLSRFLDLLSNEKSERDLLYALGLPDKALKKRDKYIKVILLVMFDVGLVSLDEYLNLRKIYVAEI